MPVSELCQIVQRRVDEAHEFGVGAVCNACLGDSSGAPLGKLLPTTSANPAATQVTRRCSDTSICSRGVAVPR